jgi:hypothetical protein
MTTGDSQADELKNLRDRYERLREEKIRADERLNQHREGLQDLQRQARERFGTYDLAILQARLNELEQENQRKLDEYRAALNAVDEQLNRIEDGRQA